MARRPRRVTLTLQLKDAQGALVGSTLTQTITLNPEVVSVTPEAVTVTKGTTITGQITLFAPFPGADQTVTIISSNTAVYFQSGATTSSSTTVTVHRGDTTAPFTMKTTLAAPRSTLVTVNP